MPRSSRWLSLLPFVCAISLSAQTYNPKTIRLQGADELDQAQVMHLVDLKPGAPVTKEQIEAAMQRLADSGLFADLSYHVDAAALVFVVKPIPGTGALPVRYSNFVWWQPGDLEPLVEARVSLFHGKLPLTGQLTTEVEAALTALLAEKGIADAKVDAMQTSVGGSGIALTVTHPRITLGTVHLTGVAPDAAEQMRNVTDRLASREFDSAETPRTIVNNTVDTHLNAGYLDVVVDQPVFSPPHKDLQGYAVDATATVRPGSLFHISSVTYDGIDPSLQKEVASHSGVKPGDAAEQMTLRIAEGLTARSFQNRGMLEAKATAQVTKDSAAHTVAYRFNVVPGPVYTFAAIDLAALSSEAQSRFQSAFHARPGAIADADLRQQVLRALNSAGITKPRVAEKLDRTKHTAVFVIAPAQQGAQADQGS